MKQPPRHFDMSPARLAAMALVLLVVLLVVQGLLSVLVLSRQQAMLSHAEQEVAAARDYRLAVDLLAQAKNLARAGKMTVMATILLSLVMAAMMALPVYRRLAVDLAGMQGPDRGGPKR